MVNAGRCDAKSIGKRWSCWTSRPRTIGKRYIFQTPLAKPMEAAEWIWRRSTQRFPLALEARSEKNVAFSNGSGGEVQTVKRFPMVSVSQPPAVSNGFGGEV